MQTQSFREAYRDLLFEITNHGVTEINARTKAKIKMIQGGYSFKLDLTNGRLPVAGNRRYYPHVAAAETAWQFMGTQDPTFIVGKAPKLWSKFVETEVYEDDRGNGPRQFTREVLKTAYGYRWRKAFGRDQIALACHELINHPTNRQLFISAWDPSSDGLGGDQPKNIPCPVGFTVSRFQDDLHMSVFIRSSDVFVGLPYDVMCYALTMDAIAATAGIRPASLHVTLAHPHLYEAHWSATEACLTGNWSANEWKEQKKLEKASTSWPSNVSPSLPGWSIAIIQDQPDTYVDVVKQLARRTKQNSWDPMPKVIE
jgi:thymidylate synthase